MYTKILVPLDGSSLAEQILPYARTLAETSGIPVELLRVNELPGLYRDRVKSIVLRRRGSLRQ